MHLIKLVSKKQQNILNKFSLLAIRCRIRVMKGVMAVHVLVMQCRHFADIVWLSVSSKHNFESIVCVFGKLIGGGG